MQTPKTASCDDLPSWASGPTFARSARPSRTRAVGRAGGGGRVLPAGEEAVIPAEHRRIRGSRGTPRETLDVEVDAEHERECGEAQSSEDGLAGVPPEPSEERGVDEQVALG